MATMTQIAKWGNSLGLRLPKSVALEAQVDEGDTVDVSVKNGGAAVKLVVEDDGAGFDTDDAGKLEGEIGLLAMREYVEMAGGTFSIVSVQGAGTTVEALVPSKVSS